MGNLGRRTRRKIIPTLERRPATEPSHIYLDTRGVAWIGQTNVKVVEVAVDNTALVMSAERIHETYPDLSLAQIHAALAYYHDHRSQLDDEIARRQARADQLQAATTNPLSRALLEARRQEKRPDDAA